MFHHGELIPVVEHSADGALQAAAVVFSGVDSREGELLWVKLKLSTTERRLMNKIYVCAHRSSALFVFSYYFGLL